MAYVKIMSKYQAKYIHRNLFANAAPQQKTQILRQNPHSFPLNHFMLRNSKDIGQTKVALTRIYPGDFQCYGAILHDSKILKWSKHAANACFSAEIA